jgi:hypothetical protein
VADYPYPRDEFDDYDLRPTPVGVHRAPASTWSRLWPFLLVIALGATVAIVAVWLLVRPHSGDDAGTPGSTPGVTQPAEPGAGDGATEPGEGEPEQGAEEPGEPDSALAAANLNAAVRVLNDTGPSGEAARGSAALQGAGFTMVEAANYAGDSGLAASSVWYQGAEYRDTALAVAYVLGIPEDRVTEHTLPQGNVNVIIRSALALP